MSALEAVLEVIREQNERERRIEAAHCATWRPHELVDNVLVAAIRRMQIQRDCGIYSIN